VRRTKRLPPEELQPYLLDPQQPPAQLDWRTVFGNDNPVELEVGFGKGLFLLTAAQSSPEVNFVGIEIERKYQLLTATRVAIRRLTNVRLVCADARVFLRDAVRPESLSAIHVYFPDPWWKKRHHKRRVFTAEFVAACERLLIPGGKLHFATDVGDYFEMATELMRTHSKMQPVPPPPEHEPAHDMDYLTNFERKARKQGKVIHRAVYQR